MAGRTAMSEVTQVFADTYRSIDIRVASLYDKEKKTWVCGLAVVRLSHEEPRVVEGRLSELSQQRMPVPLATENFKIIFGVRPFAEWKLLCAECEAGTVRVADFEVHLNKSANLDELASEIRFDPWGVRPMDGISWPGVFVGLGSADARLGHEPLVREIGPLGYSFPLEAVNELCEVNVTHGHSMGSELYVSAPVYARIETVSLLDSDSRLETRIEKHHALSGLSTTVVLRRQSFGTPDPPSYRRNIRDFEMVEDGTPIQRLLAVAPGLPTIRLDKWVEAKLVHEKLGEVHQLVQSARSLIPAVQRNPLFEALKYFCPENTLRELVANPISKKSVTLKTSAAFELHVAWLLGLCGLSTIVLGDYEHLFAPETNIPRGSVDVLASKVRSDTVLLVACTLGPPKEHDFGNLLNVQEILGREVFDGTPVRVLPVLFTGAHGQPASRKLENELWGIPIMDADRIDVLLSRIREGSERQFFEFLENPDFFDLLRSATFS